MSHHVREQGRSWQQRLTGYRANRLTAPIARGAPLEQIEVLIGADFARAGLVLAVTLGCLFRISAFLYMQSFRIDESALAVNIASRSMAELLRPLDLLQSAPLGFLWIQRLVAMPAGFADWSFRLVPLTAGIGLVFITATMARRQFSRFVAAAATASVACSPLLIYQSNHAKPYGIDAVIALVLVFIAAPLVSPTPETTTDKVRKPWRRLFLVGLFAPWFSTTSAFVVATVMVVVSVCWLLSRGSVRLVQPRLLVGSGALWIVSVLAAMSVAADAGTREAMSDIWAGGFLPLNHDGLKTATVFFGELLPRALGGSAHAIPWGAGLVLLGGAASLLKRDWATGVLFIGPPVFAVLAAMTGQYPVQVRLWVFAIPAIVMVFWSGIDAFAGFLRTRWRDMAVIAVTGMVIVPVFRQAFHQLHTPYFGENPRPGLEQVMHNLDPQDVVYIVPRALPAWMFYTSEFPLSERDRRVLKLASPPNGPAYLNSRHPRALTPDEDSALTRRRRSLEIFGASSGFRSGEWGRVRGRVDSTWAVREMQRVLRAQPHCVTLYLSHAVTEERLALRQVLESAGARLRMVPVAAEESAVRYCFSVRP